MSDRPAIAQRSRANRRPAGALKRGKVRLTRHVSLGLAAFLSVAAAAGHAQPEDAPHGLAEREQGSSRLMTFNGPLIRGMRAIIVPPAPGSPWSRGGYFLPGVAEPSEPDPADVAALLSFVEAIKAGDPAVARRHAAESLLVDFGPWFGPTERTEQWRQLRPDDFSDILSACELDTPYLLPEGEIRVSWLCAGRVGYFSFVEMEQHRVARIFTAPATVPSVLMRSPDRNSR